MNDNKGLTCLIINTISKAKESKAKETLDSLDAYSIIRELAYDLGDRNKDDKRRIYEGLKEIQSLISLLESLEELSPDVPDATPVPSPDYPDACPRSYWVTGKGGDGGKCERIKVWACHNNDTPKRIDSGKDLGCPCKGRRSGKKTRRRSQPVSYYSGARKKIYHHNDRRRSTGRREDD